MFTFTFISRDCTSMGIVDFLQPMNATFGLFVRHDELCRVSVTHTKHAGMIMGLCNRAGMTFRLNNNECDLVAEFYQQQEG